MARSYRKREHSDPFFGLSCLLDFAKYDGVVVPQGVNMDLRFSGVSPRYLEQATVSGSVIQAEGFSTLYLCSTF